MRLICLNGPQDGHTAERASCERITFGEHSDPAHAVLHTYNRTTDLVRGRVVFEYAGRETVSMQPDGIARALLALGLRTPFKLNVSDAVEVTA